MQNIKPLELPMNKYNLRDKVIVLSELSTTDGDEITIPPTRIVIGINIGVNDTIEYTLDGGITAKEDIMLYESKVEDAFRILADDYRTS